MDNLHLMRQRDPRERVLIDRFDITTEARMILSAIARSKERCDRYVITAILVGEATPAVVRLGLTGIKTFGIGRDKSRLQWSVLIDVLRSVGIVEGGSWWDPARLDGQGRAWRVMRGEESVLVDAEDLRSREVSLAEEQLQLILSEMDSDGHKHDGYRPSSGPVRSWLSWDRPITVDRLPDIERYQDTIEGAGSILHEYLQVDVSIDLRAMCILDPPNSQKAQRRDVPVLSREQMELIARRLPENLEELKALDLSPEWIESEGASFLRTPALRRLFPSSIGEREPQSRYERQCREIVARLQATCECLAAEAGIEQSQVLSQDTIEAISRKAPRTLEALALSGGLGPRRMGAWGDCFLSAILNALAAVEQKEAKQREARP